MRRAALTLAVTAVLAGAAPAGAQARSYGIEVSKGFITRLGPLRVSRDRFLADAIRAFGRPQAIRPVSGACKVRWSSLRLNATFTSFGGITDFCGQGLFQAATVRSRGWRTWAGLRVGMRSARVPELHHRARFEDGKWVLASVDVFGAYPTPTVSALVSGGRVYALALWVGSAGD